MKNGVKHSCDKRNFCEILGMKYESQWDENSELYDFLKNLCNKDVMSTLWTTKKLKASCFTLQITLRLTLCPKIGDLTNIKESMKILFVIFCNG